MDRMSLAMLRVFSDEPAFLVLDGSAAGRTGKEGMALPIAGKELMIQLFPLSAGYSPITKSVSFDPPSVMSADDTLGLYAMPGGVFEIHARFRAEKTPDKLPFVLASLAFNSSQRNLKASVYFDRAFGLAVEEGGKVIFSHSFSHSLSSAKIDLRQLYGAYFLIAEGFFDGGEEIKILSPRGDIRLLLERTASRFTAGESGTEIISVFEGTKIREVFSPAGENTFSRPSAIYAADTSDEGLFRALLYAVKNGMETLAMSLLSQSLKSDVSFSDMKEFFGDFEGVFKCADGVALFYGAGGGARRVRIFNFSVKDRKLSNITEI